MAILKITLDRKTMTEISREYIPCDVEPDYSELARYLAEKFIQDMQKRGGIGCDMAGDSKGDTKNI